MRSDIIALLKQKWAVKKEPPYVKRSEAMPIVRKLTAEEVAELERKTSKGDNARAEIARQYDQFLIEFSPNEHGEVELEEGESKLNIRNRLKGAAARRGLKLEFIRTNGIVVRFKVLSEESEEATEVVAPAHEELDLAA
jgi:hypothetical protein